MPKPKQPDACPRAPGIPPDTSQDAASGTGGLTGFSSNPRKARGLNQKSIIAGSSNRHLPGKEISLAGDRICSPTQEGTVAARQPVKNDDPGQRHGQVQETTRRRGPRHDLGSSECHSKFRWGDQCRTREAGPANGCSQRTGTGHAGSLLRTLSKRAAPAGIDRRVLWATP